MTGVPTRGSAPRLFGSPVHRPPPTARAAGGAVPARHAVVIGDICADLAAARGAGARGVLVPTPVTRQEEITAADHVADDRLGAVRLVLGLATERGATV